MKTRALVAACAAFLFTFSLNAAAQVETVIAMIITNPAAQVEIMDAWFSSDDSDVGQRVTLLANVANGPASETHTIVADFPDYESWEELDGRRAGSAAWAQQTRASASISTTISESLMLRVADNGESWSEGDFLAVIPVDVSGRGGRSTYVAAFQEMIDSDMGKEAPGMIRLVATRAGSGGASHIALLTAPSFAALNEYMDSYPDTEGFRTFRSKVDGISDTVGGQIMRVVKVWE